MLLFQNWLMWVTYFFLIFQACRSTFLSIQYTSIFLITPITLLHLVEEFDSRNLKLLFTFENLPALIAISCYIIEMKHTAGHKH
jgi:hypothetical protein